MEKEGEKKDEQVWCKQCFDPGNYAVNQVEWPTDGGSFISLVLSSLKWLGILLLPPPPIPPIT